MVVFTPFGLIHRDALYCNPTLPTDGPSIKELPSTRLDVSDHNLCRECFPSAPDTISE